MYTANPSFTKLYLDLHRAGKIFFTADHHFGHANVIKYSNRPFSSVSKMDTYLIHRWNETVGPQDIVFHLGDFTLGKNAVDYFAQLNGLILFISTPWHHDRPWLGKQSVPGAYGHSKTNLVQLLPPAVSVTFRNGSEKHFVHLSHFPLESWDRQRYGAWHLHGHSHGTLPRKKNRVDVGVDAELGRLVTDYAPIEFSILLNYIHGQDWRKHFGVESN